MQDLTKLQQADPESARTKKKEKKKNSKKELDALLGRTPKEEKKPKSTKKIHGTLKCSCTIWNRDVMACINIAVIAQWKSTHPQEDALPRPPYLCPWNVASPADMEDQQLFPTFYPFVRLDPSQVIHF